MQLKTANRKHSKIRISLTGPSGSGKTYSALLLARGLTDSWSKIAVIDSERGSADLYAHLGDYNTLSLSAPYSPERYIEAIKVCESAGIEVIVIDSTTHEWEGDGGVLDIHSKMQGNSFTNWKNLTPRHNRFIDTILKSNCHVICTIRSKQEYVINQKDGKNIPEKIGLKAITRDGFEYEMTLAFDLDMKNHAFTSKDRTTLFKNKDPFIITSETGKEIFNWCNSNPVKSEPKSDSDLNETDRRDIADKSIKGAINKLLINFTGSDELKDQAKDSVLKEALKRLELGEYKDTNSENRKRLYYFLQETGEAIVEQIMKPMKLSA